MTGLIRTLPLFDCVYLSLSWVFSFSWVCLSFFSPFLFPLQVLWSKKALCSHTSSQHLLGSDEQLMISQGSAVGLPIPSADKASPDFPERNWTSPFEGRVGQKPLCWRVFLRFATSGHSGGRQKKWKPRAKKARAAAEAAAEPGDSGLAQPESSPEAKLEGKKALGVGEERSRIFKGEGEGRRGERWWKQGKCRGRRCWLKRRKKSREGTGG